jgi:hypothetical protein
MWASLVLGIPGMLNGLLTYLNKKQENAAMSHPVWWVAWGLGVFPVFLYHASIFWVSTFPFWGWVVLKAPADALDFAKLVVGSMFGIAVHIICPRWDCHAWKQRV